MTKKIAILSGKGGCGKTSLSLSIANLLSDCKIKTLIIDCDLSTNGATYFFENLLDTNKAYCSVQNLIKDAFAEEKNNEVISINQYFDFIPSVSKIDGDLIEYVDTLFFSSEIFDHLINNYDVVIFDCQAGYSEILKDILGGTNETLFVMEADAISSASIRSLYLKIGNLINNRKSYQIFNKVTNEEYEIYNKISGGTFFTNIESVLFDWTIRKAFALSQIPSLDKASVRFNEQLLNICRVLFPEKEYIDKLNTFSKKIISKKIQDEKSQLTEKINTLYDFNKKKKNKILTSIALFYTGIAVLLSSTFILDKPKSLFGSNISLLIMIFTGACCISLLFNIIRNLSKSKNDVISYKKRLSELEKEEKNYE